MDLRAVFAGQAIQGSWQEGLGIRWATSVSISDKGSGMSQDYSRSDTERAAAVEYDMEFPDYVEIRLVWGNKARVHKVRADEFFGRGTYGAPMPAEAFVNHINRMRRQGAPE